MLRRHFLKSLGLLTGSFALPNVAYSVTYISQIRTVQILLIAGFRYYQGEKILQQLAIGQPLQRIREVDNSTMTAQLSLIGKGKSSATFLD